MHAAFYGEPRNLRGISRAYRMQALTVAAASSDAEGRPPLLATFAEMMTPDITESSMALLDAPNVTHILRFGVVNRYFHARISPASFLE